MICSAKTWRDGLIMVENHTWLNTHMYNHFMKMIQQTLKSAIERYVLLRTQKYALAITNE